MNLTETQPADTLDSVTTKQEYIQIFGAREHNLKNVDLFIPRNKLVVLTGVSGSGKSSLAFDTIYAEGQRRYMESFSAYARSFLGDMKRPDVDKIEGLSPVISIEQKTTSGNPRSTVGTQTEIYDFLRLLYARAGEAFSYITGNKMVKQSEDQILNHIIQQFDGQKLIILAPIVKGRKGHYRELFQQIRKMGFTKVRVNQEIQDITPKMQLDRYVTHDIEIVVDRIVPTEQDRFRISQSVAMAMQHGKGSLILLDAEGKDHHFSKFLMDPASGLSYNEPAPNTFSFNSPYGACPTCVGLGQIEEISEELIMPNTELSISRAGIAPLGEYRDIWIFRELAEILKAKKYSLSTPLKDIDRPTLDYILYGKKDGDSQYPSFTKSDRFEGIVNILEKQVDSGSEKIQTWISEFKTYSVCPTCNGMRLNQEALHFKIDNHNISQLAQMDIRHLYHWFENVETRLTDRQNAIASEVLKEIRKRIQFLLDVGLDYLTLDRTMKTLSGGEAQRIRLATQIGTQLVGVLYILDEPSIGLHQRDNVKLIQALKDLRDHGNTVIVVEHDKDMMLASDHVIDIGPKAGRHGGQIVAQGTPEEFLAQKSLTALYLSGEASLPPKDTIRTGTGEKITLLGAHGHNLKNVDLILPLGTFICLTGVSGSGKSTLIHETLVPLLKKHFYHSRKDPLPFVSVDGIQHLDKIIEVDQSPIGRTPRSNPATYTGVFSDIRELFTVLPESKIRGYKSGRFSFNVKGGRCETCEGAGMRLIEMEFLPSIHVPCETCKGKRYNRETLEVRFKGKSISDVLDMTVESALEFFAHQPKILRKIETLAQVGLGYITLGQHATTLSGGEAQRLKLATELSKRDTGKTLYVLDEPTTGLHFEDIRILLQALNQLVDKGNTVLVIEHNLDVVKMADHIIDLGPEGGKGGGQIIAQGTPHQIAHAPQSFTGHFLKQELFGS